jgi:hypothetical protein
MKRPRGRPRKAWDTLTHKYCNRCDAVHPLGAFSVVDKRTGRRHSWCRDCKVAYQREHRRGSQDGG